MQPNPLRDLWVGVFVLLGLGAVAYLSVQVGGLSYTGPGGLLLKANFDEIGGLSVRAPVVISGVKVGQVSSITLNEYLQAEVLLDVDASIEVPVDSSAAIRTSGLLGDQFIALDIGAEEEYLVSGEALSFTEGALNIEKLIGTLVHNADLGGDE